MSTLNLKNSIPHKPEYESYPLLTDLEFERELHYFATSTLTPLSCTYTITTTPPDPSNIFPPQTSLTFYAHTTFSPSSLDLDLIDDSDPDPESLPPHPPTPPIYEFSLLHSPITLLPQLLFRPTHDASLTTEARVTLAWPEGVTSLVEHPLTGRTEGWRALHGCEGRGVMEKLEGLVKGGGGYLEVWLGAVGVGWGVGRRRGA